METKPMIKTVRTERFEMDYAVFGQGEQPFVIVPGVSVKPVTPSAAAIAEVYADFGKQYRVYLFDRIRRIEPGYTVEQMAEDLAEALNLLGIHGADVFGSSQGGMIVQVLAARYPNLVRRAVLGSTLARQNDVSRATFTRWIELTQGGDIVALNRNIDLKVYSDIYRNLYADVFAVMEQDGTAEDMARFRVLAEACLAFDGYENLKQIQVPVLVMGSHADAVLTGEASEEIARELGCPIFMYEAYGHAVYDETPDFRRRMLEFFRA